MEPIAIIGIGCRFPGARNPETFWQLLQNGVDAITEVPANRWNIDALYDSNSGTRGKISTRWGGFLKEVDQFEPQFFGITPREAVYMDPQQRLLLEVAWEALEDAGLVAEQLARTRTGVFIGIASNDYRQRMQREYSDYSQLNAYMGTGNAFSIAANRLSYLFDFCGPSLAIDTACSSSLVAVHLACQSLHSEESNLALAGGVNLLLSPELSIIFSQAQMMAPDGRCKTFDASANGYVRGEGCGIVVLKRLSDAIKDNDNILALIKGSAINQDGRSNGLTAPNGPAQEAVIREALAKAGVTPAQISYVEAHGTGTPLGDPIEAEALGAVLSQGRSLNNPCAVGSVKTNIGHLEAAAGIASLIKVTLSLYHRQIPPSLHFQQPNPYIPFDKLPLQVQQKLEPWPEKAVPALAGVSSFGFGGTNAHIILEEVLVSKYRRQADQGSSFKVEEKIDLSAPLLRTSTYLLPISARSLESLQCLARAYLDFLAPAASSASTSLQNICYTASVRRSHHNHRLALVFRNYEELTEQLEAFLKGEVRFGLFSGSCKQRNRRPKLVFVFSGQGPQWWAMGRELLHQEPVFATTLKHCDMLLKSYVTWSLVEELMADESQSRLAETEIAQPAIFALQVALASLWQSWGVKPSAVVGHSVGEVAAAYVAGALSLEDAVKVIFHRSRLMQRATGQGKMAAVKLSLADAERLLINYEGRLAIAAINSPNSIVLSGEAAALQEVLQLLQQQHIFYQLLPVNYAFHSPQVEPFQDELVQSLQALKPQATSIPIISTVTGTVHDGQNFDAAYWGRNIREPVRFADAIAHLVQQKHNLFLELSPHPVLATNISQCLQLSDHQEGFVLPSLRRQEGELAIMLGSLGALYTLGYPIEWSHLYPFAGECVSLPSYPWQRDYYWVEEFHTQQNQQKLETPTNQIKGAKLAEKLEAKQSLTRTQLLAAVSEDRQHLLESYLSQLFAKVMGFATKVNLQQPLFSLGLDSLMALELKNQIEADLEIVIPVENFLAYNIAQFVKQVLQLVEEETSAEYSQKTELSSDQGKLWITCQKPNPQARFRLFCFPYAGAGASIFRSWSDELPPEIEVCPIQLPGRENRLGESAFTRLTPLIQTLVPLLHPYLDIPFAFFGHSMGALLSFELTREIRRQNWPCPVHLFVSASRAPQIPDFDTPLYRLPEAKFTEELRRLNSIPQKVLQDPKLMESFIPTLRSDLAVLETYFYATQEQLNCPISAFGGTQDSKVSLEQLSAWCEQTKSEFTLQMFPGDHFFLHINHQQLLQAIAQKIDQLILKSVN
jgi:acyl transferase domain-containing protein/surfactin synthase thioesterase subunit